MTPLPSCCRFFDSRFRGVAAAEELSTEFSSGMVDADPLITE